MTVATVTKNIGATGQDFTTIALWIAGAPANLTTAERWTAGSFSGTFQQGETVTGTGLTTGKYLDGDGSSYVTFGISAGDSNTLTTLTGSTSGATCVVSAKTDTGIIWQGKCANETFTSAAQTISGYTTSSTCYFELTTKTGASFVDDANVQTNDFAYGANSGAKFEISTNGGVVLTVQNDFKMSKMQLKNTHATSGRGFYSASDTYNIDVNQCIFEAPGAAAVYWTRGANKIIRNSLVYNSLSAPASGTIASVETGGKAYHCTFAMRSDGTKIASANGNFGAAATYTSCVFMGVNGTNGVHSGQTYVNCYIDEDITTSLTGCTQIAYSTANFDTVTFTGRDLKLVSGSGLIGVGTIDATNAPTDCVGTTRPQPSGAANDCVGAWELVDAGSGFNGAWAGARSRVSGGGLR